MTDVLIFYKKLKEGMVGAHQFSLRLNTLS